jgi:cellulose biosynthesis protein BcsQ
MSEQSQVPGQIATFYSYKGGTGRTLALANVACLLGQRYPKDKILMVDWDLEAPGLHRYFRDHVKSNLLGSLNRERAIEEKEGLLDLFVEVEARSRKLSLDKTDASATTVKAIYDDLPLDRFIVATDVEGLDLMKAGRFDAGYPNRVNSFDWAKLFARSEWLIRMFADKLKQHYRFILIDSRTGITDTSGICTTLLPDKLAVVFTPNRQSLTGINNLIQSATDYRRKSPDVRPLLIFPLASRVEPTRPSLRERWRFSQDDADVPGYQPMFESVFKGVYGLAECNLQKYFDEVQIQHVADYAYGEEIAVLTERDYSQDRFSLTRSFQTFTDRLEGAAPPWEEAERAGDGKPAKRIAGFMRAQMRAAFAVARRPQSVMAMLVLVAVLIVAIVYQSNVYVDLSRTNLHSQVALQEVRDRLAAVEKERQDALRQIAVVQAARLSAESNAAYTSAQLTATLTNLIVAQGELQSALETNLTLATLSRASSDTNNALSVVVSNLSLKVQNQDATIYQLLTELETFRNQRGWTNIVASSAVRLTAARGDASPLSISTNIYLWPVSIRADTVDFVVRSSPPVRPTSNPSSSRSENAVEYLVGRLVNGASTNFTVAPFEYRVTLNDIVSSQFSGDNAPSTRASAAIFSVDRRAIQTAPKDNKHP